jgi:hypothetical protein
MIGESWRIRLWAMIAAAALALQLAGAPAHAAGPAPDPSAEELAEQAYKLQQAGKFAEAIGTYVRAYNLSPMGAILFNVATLYDHKLHERALAMEYFRRYLQAPDADPGFIKKATERLSVLKTEVEAEERSRRTLPTAPPPAPTPPVSSSPPAPPLAPARDTAPSEGASGGSGWRTAGVVIGATGIAGLGASMVLGLLMKNKNDDANQFCDTSTCRDPQGVTLEHQSSTLGSAATVAFVAGASLLATGVTVFLIAPSSHAPSASIGIGPQGRSAPGVNLDVSF